MAAVSNKTFPFVCTCGRGDPNVKSNHPIGMTAGYDEEMRGLLRGYVEGGGGLLLYGGRDSEKPTATNAVLARWGAQLLDAAINDPVTNYFGLFLFLEVSLVQSPKDDARLRLEFDDTASVDLQVCPVLEWDLKLGWK